MSCHVNCFSKQSVRVPACTTPENSAIFRELPSNYVFIIIGCFHNLSANLSLFFFSPCCFHWLRLGPGKLQGVGTEPKPSSAPPPTPQSQTVTSELLGRRKKKEKYLKHTIKSLEFSIWTFSSCFCSSRVTQLCTSRRYTATGTSWTCWYGAMVKPAPI